MTGCNSSVELTLAKGIWSDLGSPTAVSVSTISGKLTSTFLGRLNTSLFQCFAIDSGAYFSNDLTTDYGALDIYGEIYKLDYYTSQLNGILGNPALMWTRIAEGDSSISRDSPVKLAALYQGLINSSNARLRLLQNDYKLAHSQSQSVDYFTIQQYGINYGPYNNGYVYGMWRA